MTGVAVVLPKSTVKWPAAPEKFRPLIEMLLPAEPLPALRPDTTGVRFTTSKSPAFSDLRPRMSFMSQARLILLLASWEAEVPVTNIELPRSASTRPYCCMARATIWACGPSVLITELTAGVFMRRKRAPRGRLVEPGETLTTCAAG